MNEAAIENRQAHRVSLVAAAHRMPWWLCLIGVAGLAFLCSLSMSWSRLPVPNCHDEFSNLLVADTLLHGRLANASPEIWQPFQSFHVVVHPSYASKFPLGPGALLALGWLLLGTPAAGIWLGAALCAGCVTWAAAGCMPRRWAALAGLLLALHPSVHHQWSLSFMNGWLTAASAALVAGCVLRLRKRYRRLDCILLGIGIGGLALTRPFEGVVFTLSAAGLLLYWWRGEKWSSQVVGSLRIAAWAAIPIAATFALDVRSQSYDHRQSMAVALPVARAAIWRGAAEYLSIAKSSFDGRVVGRCAANDSGFPLWMVAR